MSELNLVAEGKVVSIHYTLTLDDGREVDTSRGREPLNYLHGASNIVPGLEKKLNGTKAGESLTAKVSPEEGYGPRYSDAIQSIPREQMPPGVEIEPGMQLAAEGPGGTPMVLHVTEVHDDTVTVDLNHPLAGETLHFAVEVVSIRDATPEEKEHGHVH
ncbi:MAG: peptidylprolyl isomerase [Planctomycetes bacterium]|nr:peptidylprolyl isomerase [Planctomycetota bacterium]